MKIYRTAVDSTVAAQPVEYIKDESGQVFNFEKPASGSLLGGFLSVPEVIWRDLVLYGHWIEQGLLLEWAQLTSQLNNKNKTVGTYLDQLLYVDNETRDISVHAFLQPTQIGIKLRVLSPRFNSVGTAFIKV